MSIRERTTDQIWLEWTPAQKEDGGLVVDYTVRIYQGSELIRTSNYISTHEHIAFDLVPETNYRFEIEANDMESGQVSEVLSQTISTLSADGFAPPFWPAGSLLNVTDKTHHTVSLSWSQAEDGNQTGNPVTGYGVYQGDTQVGTVTGSSNTSYTVTGLSPDTEYTFKVQAVNEKTRWTTDGPSVTVTTNPQTAPGTTELRLNAPRKNINGSLYMGDTVGLELIATENGLTPTVEVAYEEWNAGRDTVQAATKDVTLTETPANSKIYKADFELTEGICKIISLQAVVQSETITTEPNLAVAGRLKVEADPGAMSPEETAEFNKIIAGSFVRVSKTGTNSLTSRFSEGSPAATLEGLEGAYQLQHFLGYDTLLHEAPSVEIKAGLETGLTYAPKTPARVKVRVVDDSSGAPLRNMAVKGETALLDDGTYTIFARTGEDGYAAADGTYFVQNVKTGSSIKLEASYPTDAKNAAVLYEDASLAADGLKIGDNEVEVRLKKVPVVTLKGVVTNNKDVPIKNANVLMAQPYKDSVFNTSCLTDGNGRYTMQVAKIDGEFSVNTEGNSVKEEITLNDGMNTHDVKVPLPEWGSLNIIVKTQDISGVETIREKNWWGVWTSVRNITKNSPATFRPDANSPYYSIIGNPGEKIEVFCQGDRSGYGREAVTVTLDENNYAEATIVLKQLGRIEVQITGQDGNPLEGKARYLYVYTKNNKFVFRTGSSVPDIDMSFSLPDDEYKAVASWDLKWGSEDFSIWQDDRNCVMIDSFTVREGEITNLGTKKPAYSGDYIRYLNHNAASGLMSSHSVAVPGTVVTLRAAYDYINSGIDSGKLELVAYVPPGTELVENSIVHRVTRGGGDVPPVIAANKNRITLDLKDRQSSAAGSLTYQVEVKDVSAYDEIRAGAELRYNVRGEPRFEEIGAVFMNTKWITLNAPSEVAKTEALEPVSLSGLAPAGNIVELYDGNIKIGEVKAAPTGLWSAEVLLPDRGMPIFHAITARTKAGSAGGTEYAESVQVLVGAEGEQLTHIILRQGERSTSVSLQQGLREFPFTLNTSGSDVLVDAIFKDGDKVKDVKISGHSTERNGNTFSARISPQIPYVTVDYNERAVGYKDILKYDHGEVPTYIKDADVKFADAAKTEADVKVEFGADGYLNSLDLPAVNLAMGNVNATVSMKVEQADFDPANAKNRTLLGNGLYGYDFSYELVDGKYVITAYLDRRLLPETAGGKGRRMSTFAAKSGLEVVKTVIEVAGKGESLIGAVGDLTKTAQMTDMLAKYERVRPNLEPHLAEYYDNQLSMMGKDILMGKTLGLVGEGVGTAANLVPLVGQVVTGIAGFISGKLLGDMFDNEFFSDYNRLMSQLKNLPAWPERSKYDAFNYSPFWWYDGKDYHQYKSVKVRPRYIIDPSGFVYEGVEDNRIEGVTATALYLPAEKAANAEEAKASTEWEFWDAEWYLQKNPLSTDAEGKYAWDVPFGWWMVQFVKDGYQTAYSDALPVPPPQLDINIPMVQLSWPQVEETVWGSGGRYVDVYFSKYMDMSAFAAANAVSLTDDRGRLVLGTIRSALNAKTGAGGLSLTKAVRFTPASPLEAGQEYKLTVNKAVADYAGFSMEEDFTETKSVTPAALIGGLSGRNIEVKPGEDITQSVKDAVSFTAADPAMEDSLDKRLAFTSSNDGVVRIWGEGDEVKILSLAEGTAEITAVSVDDPDQAAKFNVTVKYPPLPIGVTHMTILNADGMALTDLSIYTGETYAIKPNLFPENATDKTITYSSDNEQVATVSASGVISALAKGIAEIRVRTENSAVMQTIHLTVLPAQSGTGENGGSGGGGGSSADDSKPTIITPPAATEQPDPPATAEIKVDVKVDGSGKATTNVSDKAVTDAIKAAQDLAKKNGTEKNGIAVSVNISTDKAASSLSVILSPKAVSELVKAGVKELRITSSTISISFDLTSLTQFQQAGGNVTVNAAKADVNKLSAAARAAIGNRPVFDLSVQCGGKTVSNFGGGLVSVAVPYTLGAGEKAGNLFGVHVDGNKVNWLINSGYDSFAKLLRFSTGHFSTFGIGYKDDVPVFSDIAEHWAKADIEFVAARGLFAGTGNNQFSPGTSMTRGMFVTALGRMAGIDTTAYKTSKFTDVTASSYYAPYVAWAAEKGIVSGTSTTTFAPDQNINREQMAVIMSNYAKVLGYTVPKTREAVTFVDSGSIASWAEDAVQSMQMAGILTGKDQNRFDPAASATRAEVAAVLHRYVELVIDKAKKN
ncbi:S-layer homology domain-containing protein [Desulfotomaculum sp. 1211_IL3151]|uniref:S-layer homology domain-containing protein n=1 Tax=Desulfotomaculum sp. 1211_IL3151 TaxID=3084055 RepID=UPI003FA600CD